MSLRALLSSAFLVFALLCSSTASGQVAGSEQNEEAEPTTSNTTDSRKSTRNDADWQFRWIPRPSIRVGKNTRIDLRVRYKWDRVSLANEATDEESSSADLARRRVGVDGWLAGRFSFQVERELTATRDRWRDVFIDYDEFDVVQVQAGKFKLPLGLEENSSAFDLDLVFRSLVSKQLAPGRDRGVMLHGRLFTRVLRYEIGVFDHDGRNARTSNADRVFGGTTLAGRLAVQPFRLSKSRASDLHLGVAFTESEMPLGVPSLRGQTVLGESFFVSKQYVQGARRRTALEVRWRPGPFSIKSEYIRVTTERLHQSVEDTDLSPLVANGWYVSGTWAVTGERKARGLDVPRRPFLNGGIGAIEVAFRVERLTFGSGANGEPVSEGPRADHVAGNTDRATTLGLNWYLNRWIKVQWNAIHERIADPAQVGSQRRPWSSVFSIQLGL